MGLSPDSGGAALGDALVVGGTYLAAATVPLWPYLLFPLNAALVASLVCTLAALFGVGVVKGRLARMAIVTSGLQVAIIGSLSAGLGFAVGRIVNAIVGSNEPRWRTRARSVLANGAAGTWGAEMPAARFAPVS